MLFLYDIILIGDDEMEELWDVLDKDKKLTGNTMKRGWLNSRGYHLITNVWIKNAKGEYLIAKRTGNKRWPNLWGCTVGSAVAGDDSLTTALKETNEELGINLIPETGELFKEYINYVTKEKDCGEFIDVWLFVQEVDISKVVFQEEETCDVKWAKKEEISKMMEENIFIPLVDLPYFNELD